MKSDSKTTYQIFVDTTSSSYNIAKAEVEAGRATGSNAWKLIRVDEWYIDSCFNDINNTLHRVPGSVNKETRNLYGSEAYSSVFMSHENITINLFKKIIKGSGDLTLVIEYIPDEKSEKKPIPPYLAEIVDNYHITHLKK